MNVRVQSSAAWLLLAFTLPTKQASQRVGIWRKLQRYGSVPLGNSGYLLPSNPANEERFQWLATAILPPREPLRRGSKPWQKLWEAKARLKEGSCRTAWRAAMPLPWVECPFHRRPVFAEASNFQATDSGNVATTGDFVLTAEEVNPVISELQGRQISVTALHSHALTEQPRLFFMYF